MSVAELQETAPVTQNGYMTQRFLSTVEIAALWGISRPAVNKWFAEVDADAKIGDIRGWSMETVDKVKAKREASPGRGNWGPRDKQ